MLNFIFRNTRNRRLGDINRDTGNWAQAEIHYRRHLQSHPNDGGIWVQLGHSLKERELFAEAEVAYSKGAELLPDHADPHLHLGYVLKRLERYDEAMETYRKSYSLKPDGGVMTEMRSIKPMVGKKTVHMIGGDAIFFSVLDFFGYLQEHATMSGIQRVQAGISLHAIDDESINAYFIINQVEDGVFWLVDNKQLKAIIEYASGSQVVHSQLRIMLNDCLHSSVRVRPGPGSTIILLGAFWGMGNNVDQFITSKREGVRIGAYVYDIIPISHPEYCDAQLVRDFAMCLSEMCLIADFVLTISDYSQFTLRQFLQQYGGRDLPIATVPLAHSMTGTQDLEYNWPSKLQRLKGQPYVAYVSTVEGRKNHLYVVNAWKQMIEDGIDVPDLVFVGRKGWRISGLMDLLDGTSYLNGRVHIIHDLTDAELNAVYADCMFTMFTSHVEGWGLPVGESLIHGRPCIASNTSSIPEVGGDFVDYVDPQNLRHGIQVITRMIQDNEYRESRRRNIVENFVPRTWGDVSHEFVQGIVELSHPIEPNSDSYPRLTEGKLVSVADVIKGELKLMEYVPCPHRLLTFETFYPPEKIGVWMRGGHGHISFSTGFSEGEDVIVYLCLFSVEGAGHCKVTIALPLPNGKRHENVQPISLSSIGNRSLIRVKGQIGKNGICTLLFDIDEHIPKIDGDIRKIAIGLETLAFVRASNMELRTTLLEEFTFTDL